MPDDPPPLPTPTAPAVEKEPTLTKSPPAGKLFPCANCGAGVAFDPRSRALKCPYCGHEQKIAGPDRDREVAERDFEEFAFRAARGRGLVNTDRLSQVRCTGCGATVMVEGKVATDDCPFCGTHIENKPEHVEGLIAPESVIPFRLDLRAARGAFAGWLHSLWFAPSELKKVAALGQLAGVYLPYWTYDAMTSTRYHGMRGDDYHDTETYTDRDAQGNTVTRTRTVVRTRWTPVSGEVQHFFDDVLVCGSRSVPARLVSGLEPWKLGELEPFRDEFLAGLRTERYAVDLNEGLAEAKRLMEPTVDDLVRRDIGGDHQRVTDRDTRYTAVTFKHCLLPVWVAHYRYNQKLYQILVNGRTGRLSGERQWSAWKIAGLVAAVVLAVGLVIALVLSMQKARGGPPPAPQRSGRVRRAPPFDQTSRRRVGEPLPGGRGSPARCTHRSVLIDGAANPRGRKVINQSRPEFGPSFRPDLNTSPRPVTGRVGPAPTTRRRPG